MDIFAHALWATAGATKINNSLEKKSQPKISILWSAFWGFFPDLFAFTIPTFLSTISVIWGGQSFSDISHHGPQLSNTNPAFDLAGYLYQYSHSMIIFVIIFGIVWLVFKKPKFALLGWLLHIILDIPSHTIAFFATPFLFPVSHYLFPYGVRWSTPWFMILNYSLLLIVFIYFFFIKKKKALN